MKSKYLYYGQSRVEGYFLRISLVRSIRAVGRLMLFSGQHLQAYFVWRFLGLNCLGLSVGARQKIVEPQVWLV